MKHEDETGDSLVSKRSADIVVALILVAVGGLVIADSLRLGIGWAEDGPKPGLFPLLHRAADRAVEPCDDRPHPGAHDRAAGPSSGAGSSAMS